MVSFINITHCSLCCDVAVRGVALEHWNALLWYRQAGLAPRDVASQHPPQHPRSPVRTTDSHLVSRCIKISIVGTRQGQAFMQAGGVVGANGMLLHGAFEEQWDYVSGASPGWSKLNETEFLCRCVTSPVGSFQWSEIGVKILYFGVRNVGVWGLENWRGLCGDARVVDTARAVK
jgi:hypothetical protein